MNAEHLVAVVDCQPGDESRLGRLRAGVPTTISTGAPSDDEIVGRADSATVLVTLYTYTRIGAGVLEQLPALRLVATRTAGYSHIDVAAAAARGVTVVAVPEAPTTAVAEYTLGAMLMLRRGLAQASASTRAGGWEFTSFRGAELSGSTLGVIGLGRIGRRVAALGSAFGMRVLGWSRRGVQPPVEPVELDELLAASDVISVNVALTDETRLLLDARRLALIGPQAILINTARGEILDTDALCRALSEGRLAGACLDVVPGEPLSPERARELGAVPNLILTPHISWLTGETLDRQFSGLTDAVLAFCAGEPIHPVATG
jgi:phosphoglycerate dehydrogenase-like enzyme